MAHIRLSAAVVAVLLGALAGAPRAEAAPTMSLLRVDAGGSGVAGWEPDTAAQPSRRSNANAVGPGAVTTTNQAVDVSSPSLPAGTPMRLVQSIRSDGSAADPTLAYVLHVPRADTYAVRLVFAELDPSYVGAGSRVQDVVVDGTVVDDDLDVASVAGGVRKAFARTYTVTTTDHAIEVELRSVRRPAAIAALELLGPARTPVDRPGRWTDPVGGAPRLGEHAVVALSGYLYRAGGLTFVAYNRVAPSKQHDRYDPRTRRWTSLPPLPVAVDHVQAVVAQGRVWYLGGMAGGPGTGLPRGPSGQVVSFDPTTGVLRTHRSMPRPRAAGGIGALNGRIYVFGGLVSSTAATARADVYDIASNTWSRLPDLPVAKDHFKAAVIGTDIHLPGGRKATIASAMTRHDVYDTVARTYRRAATLPLPMGGSGVTIFQGRMLVAGGETKDPDAARDAVLAYDPATDRWSTWEPMHEPRHGVDLAVCGNAVYAVGGMGNFAAANVSNTVEAFTTDGSAPNCPAPPSAPAPAGPPSVVEPARFVPKGGPAAFCAL